LLAAPTNHCAGEGHVMTIVDPAEQQFSIHTEMPALMAVVDPEEVRRQLKALAAEQDRNVEDMAAEALNLLFAKYRKAEEQRKEQQYSIHPEMPAVMGTVHTRPVSRRSIPCLTRHQTFWMPERLENALRGPERGRPGTPEVLTELWEREGLTEEIKKDILRIHVYSQDKKDVIQKTKQLDLKFLNETISHTEQEYMAWALSLEKFILNIYDKLYQNYEALKSTGLPEPSLTNYQPKPERSFGLLQNVYDEAPHHHRFKEPISDVIYQAVCIKGVWHSMPIEILVELRAEFVTVTTTIDLGHPKAHFLYREDNAGYCYRDVIQALRSFDDVMAFRYKKTATTSPPLDDDDGHHHREKLKQAYATLYQTLDESNDCKQKSMWLRCREQLYGGAIEKAGKDNIGRLIGDMRCLVLHRAAMPPAAATTEAVSREQVSENHAPLPEPFITLPHFEKPESSPSLVAQIDGHPFGNNDGEDESQRATNRRKDIIRIVDTINPFMLVDPHMTDQTETELAVSTFFDETGIHMSAVSLQNRNPRKWRINPLPCVSLVTRNDEVEIGHLVEIGNRINTMRVAALYSYAAILTANRALHEVEQRVNELSRQLLRELERNPREVKNQLLGFSEDIARIEYSVPGGLSYRGDRSVYYRTQFAAVTKLLRGGAVPGHEPFNEMVERRIGPAYGIINLAQQRLDRITKAINEAEEDVQTDREVKSLDAIRKLQKSAEFGFWFVLFPYYATTFILHYVLGEQRVKIWDDYVVDEWGILVHEFTALCVGFAVFAIGAFMAVRALAEEKSLPTSDKPSSPEEQSPVEQNLVKKDRPWRLSNSRLAKRLLGTALPL
jgi:Protein of unknown function (DUF3422)